MEIEFWNKIFCIFFLTMYLELKLVIRFLCVMTIEQSYFAPNIWWKYIYDAIYW